MLLSPPSYVHESEEEPDLQYEPSCDIDMEAGNVAVSRKASVIDLICGDIEVTKDTPKEKEVHWIISLSSLPFYCVHNAPVFTFLNVRWCLGVKPIKRKIFDTIALDLKIDNVGLAVNMLCTFSIKKADGSLYGTVALKQMFCLQNLILSVNPFVTQGALWSNKAELIPYDKLTIVCNMKQLPYPSKLSEVDLLSDDIRSLLTDQQFSDVTLYVKDREFKAHRIILAARSPVFASYFRNETSEKQNGVVNIPDCDPESFSGFLEYLYCGKLENMSFYKALNLYKTANKYDVPALKLFCVEHMERNLDVECFFDVLPLAELHEDKSLSNATQKFFNENLNKIFATSEWKKLMKNNSDLANRLLMEMSSDVKVVSKYRRQL